MTAHNKTRHTTAPVAEEVSGAVSLPHEDGHDVVVRTAIDDSLASGADETSDASDPEYLIAERAYLLYLNRAEDEGDSLSDWLEAERQVQSERDQPRKDY